MAYTKTNWENGVTPLNATNLNHIEQGIYDVDTGVYKKNEFAVLTGTLTLPEASSGTLQGNAYINYPSGFNKSNCVIISLMAQRQDTQGGYATTNQVNSSSVSQGTADLRAALKDDNIQISETKLSDGQASKIIEFKVVLLKY